MINKCIFTMKSNPQCKYRLFCLPYAGSGASLYAQWSKYVDEEIEICSIQLPGRENRRNESLCMDYQKIVSEICDSIADLLDKPFAIFGYSMGGILAYELTLQIYQRFRKKPQKLFMSASSIFRDKKPHEISEMNEHELIQYMEKSGGVPSAVLHDTAFRKEYFPIIRNDYALIEHYHFDYKKVPCDIVAFASKEDTEVRYENIRLLRFFTKSFDLYQMHGSHFFIRQEFRKLGKIVSNELLA